MEPLCAAPLFAEFPEVSDAEWRRAAAESLDGASFEQRLITRTPEGIDLQPIYTRAAAAGLAPLGDWPGLPPFVRGADPLGSRAGGWLIAQKIAGRTPAEFNAALRAALERGQNAVPLAEAQCWTRADELGAALAGVELAAVRLFAHAGCDGAAFAEAFLGWRHREGIPARAVQGAILCDPVAAWVTRGGLPRPWERLLDETAALTQQLAGDGIPLRTVGVDASVWAEAGGHAVQELAFALATGVEYARALDARGVGVDVAGPRLLFTFGLGAHFFLQIAKLRAARALWARAMQAAGGGPEAQRLVCHGRTARWNKSALDPQVNLLRATAESFAGVMGGVAGLQVEPFDAAGGAPSPLAERLARNLQIILAEECQLGRVVDPAGGSWFVETLTQQLAEKAWSLFQELEARGGMAAAIRAGFPQALVAQAAAARREAVETRRDGVIGVNLHPNLREECGPAPVAAMPRADLTAERVPAIVAQRRAEPFEALRRRAAAFTARTGRRPQVLLAKFGPRKQHAARAEFSAGFFAVGGFDVNAGAAFDAPEAAAAAALASGAPLVVICSSDETYPALVPPFAAALKAALSPPLVVLAGLPAPEVQAQFRAAGVDEFIHLRANCAHLLAGFQTRLGF